MSLGERMRRGRLALVAGVGAVALATACNAGAGERADEPAAPEVSAAPEAGVMAPAKVEVIAALTGCEPKIRIDAEELRQGVCHTGPADYLITTFPEERLKETWLDSARVYGGRYLVGTRWVVSARAETLDGLRDRLGGSVREL
ncbi:hypothetical protein ACIQNG_28690 [Streptomyces sp. NPDC091377]|uniref:hypothetical protein n=1 Tax=Streptomyces sp. NPDC091377 TaxID=3365995 RepID=UPI003825E585